MSTDIPIPSADDFADSPQLDALLDKAEWYAIIGRHNFAFRFGPFTGPEIGKVMAQCIEEKLPLLVTAQCGAPINWEAARLLCGHAADGSGPLPAEPATEAKP